MKYLMVLMLSFLGSPIWADIVVPSRTLRAGDILSVDVLRIVGGTNPGSFDTLEDVIGQEAQTALYANRPIFFEQLGPPALIERNQIVQLRFAGSRLMINTEGRALERGGVGDRIKIMNLSSRFTLFGYVQNDGQVAVYN